MKLGFMSHQHMGDGDLSLKDHPKDRRSKRLNWDPWNRSLVHNQPDHGMDMWNAPTVQSRQPLTYRLMESVGLGGPR